MNNQRTEYSDPFFKKNRPRIRIPLVFIIDVSGSMDPLKTDLNKAIRTLLRQMKANDKLCRCVDLLVIHFNGAATPVVDFECLEDVKEDDVVLNENIKLKGYTDTGKAILEALNRTKKKREAIYKESGKKNKPKQPLVFLLTDGIPDAGQRDEENETDEEYQAAVDAVNQAYQSAANQIKEMEINEKITFVATGIKHPNQEDDELEKKLQELTNYPDHVVIIGNTEADFSKFCDNIYEGTITELDNTDPNNAFNSICNSYINF